MLLPPLSKRPTYELETALHARGLLRVAGIDEVGRGPLAGPVVAAAVILSAESVERPWMARIHDSKLVTPRQREELAGLLKKEGAGVAIGEVSAQEIDRMGIVRATHTAMVLALKQLSEQPDFILIDGRERLPIAIPQQSIVKGDRQVLSIAAASIVAKVYRDGLMEALGAQFPGWGFEQHKGYGSPQHLDALRRLGPSPIHRLTFGSVSDRLSEHPTPTATSDTRRGLGAWGERRAREYLEDLGYRVLETNYRSNAGEIDLVALEGGCLVCVEVRTRRGRSYGTPEESIVGDKARRLMALTEEYAQAHPELPVDIRIDVVAIELTIRGRLLRIDVIRNAVEG